MQPIPFVVGVCLAGGAVALLISDGIASGHWTINHALQPLMVFGTVAAAVWVHKAKWFAKPAFLFLALLGSLLTCYGTMGRQADTRDGREQEARRQNRTLETKLEELREARAGAKLECTKLGPRCQAWQARVDALTKEASGISAVSVDPRAEAIAKLAILAGANGDQTKAFVGAIDPVALPLFLELGSVLFFAAAFPKSRNSQRELTLSQQLQPEITDIPQQLQPVAPNSEETVIAIFTRDMALRDFRRMKDAGSQRLLSERWGVDKSTVSRWLKDWETEGLVQRHRNGKEKPVLALPPPKHA